MEAPVRFIPGWATTKTARRNGAQIGNIRRTKRERQGSERDIRGDLLKLGAAMMHGFEAMMPHPSRKAAIESCQTPLQEDGLLITAVIR